MLLSLLCNAMVASSSGPSHPSSSSSQAPRAAEDAAPGTRGSSGTGAPQPRAPHRDGCETTGTTATGQPQVLSLFPTPGAALCRAHTVELPGPSLSSRRPSLLALSSRPTSTSPRLLEMLGQALPRLSRTVALYWIGGAYLHYSNSFN